MERARSGREGRSAAPLSSGREFVAPAAARIHTAPQCGAKVHTAPPRGAKVHAAPPRGAKVSARGRAAGFSLVELLAVLVVMGLIATMVTINWRSILPKTELHSAVRELSSILQGTRSDAIARNATFELQYDLDEHRYRVVTPFRVGGGLAPSNDERQALAWHPLPATVRFGTITIGTDIFEKGIVLVRFDPLGSASGHVIVLRQPADDNVYTIEVQGLLGLINYHEGLFERLPPREDDFK